MPEAMVLPPKPGNCAHCGVEVPKDQHVRQYTIEGTGIDVPVTHCDECVDSDDCTATCNEEK